MPNLSDAALKAMASKIMQSLADDVSEGCAAIGVNIYAASWDRVERKLYDTLRTIRDQQRARDAEIAELHTHARPIHRHGDCGSNIATAIRGGEGG